ncbi:acetyltransferase [Vibrio mimicus]|nr:acetyltransferase [Vibrio mimicus]
MVTVVVFEFSGMRCQPLRRALCVGLFPNVYGARFEIYYVGKVQRLCFKKSRRILV